MVFPRKGRPGTGGGGSTLKILVLRRILRTLYLIDTGGPAIVPVYGSEGPAEAYRVIPYPSPVTPKTFNGAQVTPVIAPDTSSAVTGLLDSAQESIEIQQAYITNESKTDLNPYLVTSINASRRGVHVRILLDSYWYNTADEADNDEMVALINRIAAIEHLPLEARCANLAASGLEKIHNKGVIVDDREVLVSSINWNTNSPDFNREAGVIVEQPEVARVFPRGVRCRLEPGGPFATTNNGLPENYMRHATVIGLLLVLYYRRHIR